MAQENNDFFRLAIANPDLTPEVFMEAGYNVTNLQLLDKDQYKKIDSVRDFYTDDQGNFREDQFNQDYAQIYNQYVAMAAHQNAQEFKKYTLYDDDNIFAPKEQKRNSTPVITRISNPKHLSNSQQVFGWVGDPVKSDDEIAQQSKVLMNPIEATNPDGTINNEKAVWDEAPDEGVLSGQFWRNFAKTFVMAQWEEDGEHVNPVTGVTEKHQKGQLKLNDLGDPYYEYLDGRNIYGKRVLNKMNVLTPEDSWIQQYDFFDSDGIGPKSYTGVLFKNLALVGSMYLPGIGPYLAMISMIGQVARLGAIGAKMMGQEGFWSNSIEGYVTSWDRQHLRTEYDATHAWSFNNWFSGCADLAAQIAEQRAIFNTIPWLIKGKRVASAKDQETVLDWFKKEAIKRRTAEYDALGQKLVNRTTEKEVLEARKLLDEAIKVGDKAKIAAAEKLVAEKTAEFNFAKTALKNPFEASAIGMMEGQEEAKAFFNSYNKWGEMLSKTYMAGLISSNLYNEARTAGLDEDTAAWLTIGRFAAEMALLMTPIGDYFLPELHMGQLEAKGLASAAVQTVVKEFESTGKNATNGVAKQAWHRWLWDYAKKIPEQGRNILKRGSFSEQALSAVTMGTEAGIVNDIEALFDDLAKAAYTVLTGNENEQFKAFENNFDRYGMGMVTGVIGGSFSAGFSQYKNLNVNGKLSSEEAFQKIAHMTRNDQIDDFLRTVDKKSTHLGSDYLTAFPYLTIDGTYSNIADPNAKDLQHMSQNKYLKAMIHQFVDDVRTILQTSGAGISDGKFLSSQIAGDLRLQYFLNTTAASRYLQDFNTEVVDLIRKGMAILPTSQATDSNKAKAKQDAKAAEESSTPNIMADNIKAYDEQLKKVQDLMKGKKAVELARDSMYELTPLLFTVFNPEMLNEKLYVEWRTNRSYDSLPEADRTKALKEYNEIISNKDKTHAMSLLFFDKFVKGMSDSLNKLAEEWKEQGTHTEDWKILQNFHSQVYQTLKFLNDPNKLSPGDWVAEVQERSGNTWLGMDSSESNENAVNVQPGAQALALTLQRASNLLRRLPNLLKRPYLSPEDKQVLTEAVDQLVKLNNLYSEIDSDLSNYLLEKKDEKKVPYKNALLKNGLSEQELTVETQKALEEAYKAFKSAFMDIKIDDQTFFEESDKDAPYLYSVNDGGDYGTYAFQNKANTVIRDKASSNITNILSTLALQPDNENSSILNLFQVLTDNYNTAISTEKLNTFSDINYIPKIKKALFYLRGIQGAVMTARTQESTQQDPYGGFNQVLNTLANNYNSQAGINEKLEWKDLATMDAGYADLVSDDIQNIIDKFEHYLMVIQQNSAQLLNQQHAVQLVYLQAYKTKAEIFVKNILDNKADILPMGSPQSNEVEEALSTIWMEIRDLDVNFKESDLLNIYHATLQLKELIYNVGKELNILNADGSQLAGIFSYKVFGEDLMAPTANTLDNDLKSMDSRVSLYTIAADLVAPAGSRYKQVKAAYKATNAARKGRPLAIIPAQLELAMIGYSHLLNKKFFDKVQNAYKTNIKQYWAESKENRLKLLKSILPTINGQQFEDKELNKVLSDLDQQYCLLFLNVPEFDAMCTGIAGAGKSEAYLTIIKYLAEKTLSQDGKPFRVAYISTSKEKAINTAKRINNTDTINEDDCFSHEDFIDVIASEDAKGKADYFSTYTYDEESGLLQTTAELKNAEELKNKYHYDLVIVDEVGFYNKARMQLVQKYGELAEAHIHVVGDLEQTHAREKYPCNSDHLKNIPQVLKDVKGAILNFELTLQDANFVQGLKLGIAMRPNNQQQANGAQELRKSKTDFELHYTTLYDEQLPKSEQGLFGIQVEQLNYDFDNKTFKYDNDWIDQQLTEIEKLVKTLNEGEFIGFIYTSENSALYQKLKDAYKDKIKFYQSDLTATSNEKLAQGDECRYFIAECPTYAVQEGNTYKEKVGDVFSAKDSLYTAASRSIQGTILITPPDQFSYFTFKNIQDAQPMRCSYDNKEIERRNKDFDKIMDTILNLVTDTAPVYQNPFQEGPSMTNETTSLLGITQFNYEGNGCTVISISDTEVTYTRNDDQSGQENHIGIDQFIKFMKEGTITTPPLEESSLPTFNNNITDSEKAFEAIQEDERTELENPNDQKVEQHVEAEGNQQNVVVSPEAVTPEDSNSSLTNNLEQEEQQELPKESKPTADDIKSDIRLYTYNTVNTRVDELVNIDDLTELKNALEKACNSGARDGIYGIYFAYKDADFLKGVTSAQEYLQLLEDKFLKVRGAIISNPNCEELPIRWAIHTIARPGSKSHDWSTYPEESRITHSVSTVTTSYNKIPRQQLVALYTFNERTIIIPIGTFSSFVTIVRRNLNNDAYKRLLTNINTEIEKIFDEINTDKSVYYKNIESYLEDKNDEVVNTLRTLFNFWKNSVDNLYVLDTVNDGIVTPLFNLYDVPSLGVQISSYKGKYAYNPAVEMSKSSIQTPDASYVQKKNGNYYLTYKEEGEIINPTSLCAQPQVALKEMVIKQDGKKITIKAGHAFTIVADVTVNTQHATLSSAQLLDALKGDTLKKGYHIVFLRSASASVSEFINNYQNVLIKSGNVQRIGGDMTSFRILQALFRNEQFKNDLKQKNAYLFEALRAQIENNARSGKELLSWLRELVSTQLRPTTKLQRKSFLNTYLVDIAKIFSIKVEDYLNDTEKEQLYDWLSYNIPVNKQQGVENYVAVDWDRLGDRPLFSTVKVDSPVWQGSELFNIMESFTKLNPEERSQQTNKGLRLLGILKSTSSGTSTTNENPNEVAILTIAELQAKYTTPVPLIHTRDNKTFEFEEGTKVTIKSVSWDTVKNRVLYIGEDGATYSVQVNKDGNGAKLILEKAAPTQSLTEDEIISLITEKFYERNVDADVNVDIQELLYLSEIAKEVSDQQKNDFLQEYWDGSTLNVQSAWAIMLGSNIDADMFREKILEMLNQKPDSEMTAGCSSLSLILKI